MFYRPWQFTQCTLMSLFGSLTITKKFTMIRIQNVLQFIFKSIVFLETDISIVYFFKFSAPCTDVYDRCGVYISACGQSQFMRDYCKKTCGECVPPAPTGNCKQYKHTLEKRSWTSVQYVSSNFKIFIIHVIALFLHDRT